MKRILALLLVLSGLVFPWACSDNKTPSQPSGSPGLGATSTPTGTLTPGTPTYTPTLVIGANTFTPTPTFALPAPVYQNNFSTSAAPRGMVLSGGNLTVAENEFKAGGIVTEFESYTGAGTASLNLYNCGSLGNEPCVGNVVLTGAPPPLPTPGTPIPAFVPVTVGLQQIQGYVNPGGNVPGAWSAILDLNSSGGAVLYAGYYDSWNNTNPVQGPDYMPFLGTDYGGVPFKNPQCMTDDGPGGTGHIYIADTGNGMVDELSPYEPQAGLPAHPIHR